MILSYVLNILEKEEAILSRMKQTFQFITCILLVIYW